MRTKQYAVNYSAHYLPAVDRGVSCDVRHEPAAPRHKALKHHAAPRQSKTRWHRLQQRDLQRRFRRLPHKQHPVNLRLPPTAPRQNPRRLRHPLKPHQQNRRILARRRHLRDALWSATLPTKKIRQGCGEF